jgi:hypothetical protein
MRGLEGQAEALAGTFKAQAVANTLRAFATMALEPGEGLMRELEGRAEALRHVHGAERGKHAVGVCDDGAGARGGADAGAGGAGGGGGGHVRCAGGGKHAVGVCDDDAGARGGA